MMKVTLFLGSMLFVGVVTPFGAQTAPPTAPRVTVGKQLTAKASAPKPGVAAKKTAEKTSIGRGPTSVKASQPSAFWVEEFDVDDDGKAETNEFLFDARRGVLYTYRADDFACANGSPASGSILMALYAKGNPANQPVGSGWYLVQVHAGMCAAKRSDTFGCRFDASGNPTECGAATVNHATGELHVVVPK